MIISMIKNNFEKFKDWYSQENKDWCGWYIHNHKATHTVQHGHTQHHTYNKICTHNSTYTLIHTHGHIKYKHTKEEILLYLMKTYQ